MGNQNRLIDHQNDHEQNRGKVDTHLNSSEGNMYTKRHKEGEISKVVPNDELEESDIDSEVGNDSYD